MLNEKEARTLAERVLRLSAAEHTEVSVFTEDSSLTRFADNAIHQNVAQRDASVVVRASVGKRYGVGATNDLSDAGLQGAVDQVISIARAMPDMEEFLPPLEPQGIAKVDGFSIATAEFGPLQRAAGVRVICELASEKGLTAAGAFKVDIDGVTVANSQGLYAHHESTSAELLAVAMSVDSSGHSGQISTDVTRIDPEAVALEAVGKAERGRGPKSVDPGEYEVVLEEYAVSDMLDFLAYLGFGAQAVHEGRSFMSGKIGQQVMGSNITIRDDGMDPTGMVRPFDFEGYPKQPVGLIVEGVAASPVHDRRTAAREGGSSTGHALPVGSVIGPLPMNLFLQPGHASKEEMIASVQRGILVTRFWYTRVVHPLTVHMTGMTRDGAFLIEKGEVVGPVKNLRFTQSYLEALNNVDLIGKETKLVREFFAANRVPAIKVGRWAFTGATEY